MSKTQPENAALFAWRRAVPVASVALVALLATAVPAANAAPLRNADAGCALIAGGDGPIVACGAIEVVPCANSWNVVGAASAEVTWTLNGQSSDGETIRRSGQAQDPLNSNPVNLYLYANGHLVASAHSLGCRSA